MHSVRTFTYIADGAASAEVLAYGAHVRNLLGTPEHRGPVMSTDAAGMAATAAFDLLVYAEPLQPWWRRWLLGSPAQRLAARGSTSLLVVRQPRWPIRRILLIARAEPTDETALSWALRLAQPRRTVVSILPIVPPWPRLHRADRHIQPDPDILLHPCTVSGALLRHMVQQLHQRRIPAVLSLHRGEPDEQIRAEVAASNPDLVLIAAESSHWLWRWLCGELVAPLLRWVDRPVLIVRPPSRAASDLHMGKECKNGTEDASPLSRRAQPSI